MIDISMLEKIPDEKGLTGLLSLLITQSNAHEKQLAELRRDVEASATSIGLMQHQAFHAEGIVKMFEKLQERVECLEKLPNPDDLIESLIQQQNEHSRQLKRLIEGKADDECMMDLRRRVERLERHFHCRHRNASDDNQETTRPIYDDPHELIAQLEVGVPNDRTDKNGSETAQSGHWECEECGSCDQGTLFEHDKPGEPFVCSSCGAEAVTWHPDPPAESRAESDERCRNCEALTTTIDERDEAYDEIDRLNTALSQEKEVVDDYSQEIDQLKAEINLLHDLHRVDADTLKKLDDEVAWLKAENAKLRENNADLGTTLKTYLDEVNELRAEKAHLQNDLTRAREEMQMETDRACRAGIDIDKLRADLAEAREKLEWANKRCR